MKRRKFLKAALWVPPLFAIGRARGQALSVGDLSVGTITSGSGGGGGGTPAYVGEIQRGQELGAPTSTTVITLASGVSSGNRVVILFKWYLGTQTISSIADSRGNTYVVDKTLTHDTSVYHAVISAHVTTALQTSDTITITFSASGTSYRAWCVVNLSGCASSSAVDQTGSGFAFGTSVSAAASTTAAATVLVGQVDLFSIANTYGSSAWDSIGAAYDWSGNGQRTYFLKKVLTSAGSQNPSGTVSANESWGVTWVAYK